MAVLDAVIDWARNELLPWQADAVRRFLTQDMLSETDKTELLMMLKANNGLADPKLRTVKPQLPEKGFVSGAPKVATRVTLKAMKDLCNINAIPDGLGLLFGHEGLTVIYGENAAGKSGMHGY